MIMATREYERSVMEVLSDLLTQFTTLLGKESQIARAEMSEKMTQMGMGLALIIGGAVLLMPALVVLLEAAVAALQQAGFAPLWAALITGGGTLLVGLILLLIGVNCLKAEKLVPNKTIQQIQKDASVAKRQMRQSDEYQRAA